MPTASAHVRCADHVPPDYFTCLAVSTWVAWDLNEVTNLTTWPINTTERSLECAWHSCSCSAPTLLWNKWDYSVHPGVLISTVKHELLSTITIGGELQDVAPPLKIAFQHYYEKPDWLYTDSWRDWHGNLAGEFWAGAASFSTSWNNTINQADYWQPQYMQDGILIQETSMYMHDEIMFHETSIIENGRCVADEAYSWGFSSLLLLTFCCYTIAFALALIVLQTDVYWNSRHDRRHQSHSIYTDVLYLAQELKDTFGGKVEDHQQSPRSFEKRVDRWEQGLRLDVGELPLSRWQEWRLSRAAKRADRKAKIAPASVDTHDPTLELRNLSSRTPGGSAVSDTAYHALIGGGGTESDSEAASRSDDRSTPGELAPSLIGVDIPTGGFGDDGMVLEEPAAESYLLTNAAYGDAFTEGRDLQDRSPRID
jgi:hypothetical protein